MTHIVSNQITAGILALALAVAVGLSTTTAPTSARTFNFNSAGSMVQQPLPPRWGCVTLRALRPGTPMFHCRAGVGRV
jgi:hypothetical protein